MKIKKIPALALAALLTASLCGCGSGTKVSDADTNTNNSSTPDNSSDNLSQSVPDSTSSTSDYASFLKGAMGDPINLSEIVSANVSPELLTESNFQYASINSAYYALPKYPCRTSFDETFNAAELCFTDIPQGYESGDYIKVKEGDKIGNFTVDYASSSFNTNAYFIGGIVGTTLNLKGETTLTGYAQIVPEDEYGVSAGDILFIPTGKVDLPVVRFDSTDDNGLITRRTGDVSILGDISFTNDFGGYFHFGNINETAADLSCIPADGSFAKVSVTVSGIRMSSTLDWLTRTHADIVSVSPAE